jgi:beta-fructofuranosidase
VAPQHHATLCPRGIARVDQRRIIRARVVHQQPATERFHDRANVDEHDVPESDAPWLHVVAAFFSDVDHVVVRRERVATNLKDVRRIRNVAPPKHAHDQHWQILDARIEPQAVERSLLRFAVVHVGVAAEPALRGQVDPALELRFDVELATPRQRQVDPQRPVLRAALDGHPRGSARRLEREAVGTRVEERVARSDLVDSVRWRQQLARRCAHLHARLQSPAALLVPHGAAQDRHADHMLQPGQMTSVDPQWPTFHFLPPSNWMNDPNGFIQWDDTFHLFYQYNPEAAVHENMHWGHAASEDLVHWRHLPIALAPTPGGPDARGCWSGVTVDDAGTPTIIYSGAVGQRQRACVATSHDGLLTWHKEPRNPVIPEPPPGVDVTEYRDHSVWREPDGWYQLMGAGIRDVGGAALLYRSANLRDWDYLHALSAPQWQDPDGVMACPMWECPDFFALDDQHVLIASMWDARRLCYAAAAVGTYADHRFAPRTIRRLDHGDGHFYAPQSTRARDGRRIVIGWVQEGRAVPAQVAAGWSGTMSVPRELTLGQDGWLRIQPVSELASLRGACVRVAAAEIAPDRPRVLDDMRGDALELDVLLEPAPGGRSGLAVRRSPDGSEQTLVIYDAAARELQVDRSHASLDSEVRSSTHSAPLDLAPGAPLRVRIFVDHSVLEVFANDTLSVTTRVYPTRDDSVGIALLADRPGARLLQLDAWPMASIWAR